MTDRDTAPDFFTTDIMRSKKTDYGQFMDSLADYGQFMDSLAVL